MAGSARHCSRFVAAFMRGIMRGGVAMAAIRRLRGSRRHLRVVAGSRSTMGQTALPALRKFWLFRRAVNRARWLRAARSASVMSALRCRSVIYAILTQESIGKPCSSPAVIPRGIIAASRLHDRDSSLVASSRKSGPAGRACQLAGPRPLLVQVLPVIRCVRGGDRQHLRQLGEPIGLPGGAAACGILAVVTTVACTWAFSTGTLPALQSMLP